jgi:hypothetical protein
MFSSINKKKKARDTHTVRIPYLLVAFALYKDEARKKHYHKMRKRLKSYFILKIFVVFYHVR